MGSCLVSPLMISYSDFVIFLLFIIRYFLLEIDVSQLHFAIWTMLSSVKVTGFDICNLQALPIYLDKLFNQYVAILLSVTFVLAFGEVCMPFY